MKKRISGCIIVIPLHLSLGYPCDYLDQTANILAKNNLVIFYDFNNPSLFLESLKTIPIFFKNLQGFAKGKNETIYFRPLSFFPTFNLSFMHKFNRFLGMLQLKTILKSKGKKILVWGFDPSVEPVLGNLGENVSIYDCVDMLGEDPQTEKSKILEKKLFKKVNIISFNSEGLRRQKTDQNKFIKSKSFTNVCGCAVELFENTVRTIPAELKSIKGKKVIMAGNFDYRLDATLLDYLLKNNPGLNFIFIGSILKDADNLFRKLLTEKNAHYLGKKDKKELVQYYKNSAVGMIPYNTSFKFVKYSNPMKAYEYLASGLPVVSTGIIALRNYSKDLVYSTDDKAEFSRKLIELIKNWSAKKKRLAKNIAEENSWENKVKKIEEYIINNT